MKHKKIIITILFLLFTVWMIVTNISVKLTTVRVAYETLSASFDGYKIIQISDLHNAEFGDDNESLINMVRNAEPDMIALTGDLIDSTNTDIEVALSFVEEIAGIAPCYYVTGNHEAWIRDEQYQQLENGLVEHGVTILRDQEVLIEKNGEAISLIGVDDPDFASGTNGIALRMAAEDISELSSPDLFTIMLSHRPEYYNVYRETDVNLVLSGHAHGGQFRLPFVGGLVAPGQGLFPEYDSGIYGEGEFAMVVSRGIGNSIIPIRFNNQPEIILIELQRK